MPATPGDQTSWNGLAVATPIRVPLAKNSTDSIVPSESDAEATIVVARPAALDESGLGDVMPTTGGWLATTFTVISADVMAILLTPVTRAERRCVPIPTLLFQLKTKGGASTGVGGGVAVPVAGAAFGRESLSCPLTRNSTVLSDATPPSAPDARTVIGTVEP